MDGKRQDTLLLNCSFVDRVNLRHRSLFGVLTYLVQRFSPKTVFVRSTHGDMRVRTWSTQRVATRNVRHFSVSHWHYVPNVDHIYLR